MLNMYVSMYYILRPTEYNRMTPTHLSHAARYAELMDRESAKLSQSGAKLGECLVGGPHIKKINGLVNDDTTIMYSSG